MGAVSTGEDPEPWVELGARIGEAFQVADDLKDVTCCLLYTSPSPRDIS